MSKFELNLDAETVTVYLERLPYDIGKIALVKGRNNAADTILEEALKNMRGTTLDPSYVESKMRKVKSKDEAYISAAVAGVFLNRFTHSIVQVPTAWDKQTVEEKIAKNEYARLPYRKYFEPFYRRKGYYKNMPGVSPIPAYQKPKGMTAQIKTGVTRRFNSAFPIMPKTNKGGVITLRRNEAGKLEPAFGIAPFQLFIGTIRQHDYKFANILTDKVREAIEAMIA